MNADEVRHLIARERVDNSQLVLQLAEAVVKTETRLSLMSDAMAKQSAAFDALVFLCNALREAQDLDRPQFLTMIGELAEAGATTHKLLVAVKDGLGPVLLGLEARIAALEKSRPSS
jgi:hypothetical protein